MPAYKRFPEFRPETLAAIATPALIIDLDAFDANMKLMADLADEHGVSLRPHVKAHKSPEIARRQIGAGAIGVSCATLQEAETMVDADIGSVLLTTPVAGAPALQRIVKLNHRLADFVVTVDHPDWVGKLEDASKAAGKTQSVLIDINVGQDRTGVTGFDAALELADLINGYEYLELKGIQAYYGHLQHVAEFEKRVEATAAARRDIRSIVGRFRELGQNLEIVSGGGTGTHLIDMEDGVFTEIQAGSYLFLDEQYKAVALHPDNPLPFKQALFVQGTVVSANQTDKRIIDCGWKAFATEGKPPTAVVAGAQYIFMGDEHGALTGDAGSLPGLGQPAILSPPHCDPTVNLFSAYHCIRDGKLTDTWPIEARGYAWKG